MKNLAKGIGAAIGYLGLYLLVSLVLTLALIIGYAVEIGFSGDINAYMQLEEYLVAFLLDKGNLLSIITAVVTLVFYLVIQILWKKTIKSTLFLNPVSFKKWWPIPFLGIALNVFTSFVLDSIPIPEHIIESYSELTSSFNEISIILIITVVIVAPIFEEIMCRALVMNSLNRGMPLTLAIIIQAILFGLLHVHIISIAYATCLGIILAIVRIRYNSLYPCILLHMMYNAANYILLPLYNILPEADYVFYLLGLISAILSVVLFVLMLKKTKNYKSLYNKNNSDVSAHIEDLYTENIVIP